MSNGIALGPTANKFEMFSLPTNKRNYQGKLIDSRTIFEANPSLKNYSELEPYVRQMSQSSKMGMLTQGGTLLKMFEKNARVIYKDDGADGYTHKLYIQGGELRGTIIKVDDKVVNTPNTAETQLGRGRSIFYLTMDVEWWGERDVLIVDELQEVNLLVQSIEPAGRGWRYGLVINNMDEGAYIKAGWLRGGLKVHQIGSLRGEAAIERGNVHFGKDDSYIQFYTPPTRMGWQTKVTDDAWKRMNHYAMRAKTGMGSAWEEEFGSNIFTVSDIDMKFKQKTDRMIDLWLSYGRASGKYAGAYQDGITDRYLQSGPAFYEWAEGANTAWYPIESGSIKYFANTLNRFWHNTVDINDRGVDFVTGSLGILLWQDWCRKADIEMYHGSEELNLGKAKAFDNKHNGVMINKKQYVGAYIQPFGEVRVHYSPFMDDDRIDPRKYKGYSIRSAEFIALDWGAANAEDANIFIIKDNIESQFTHGIGLWSPQGKVGGVPGLSARYSNTLKKENAYEIIRDEKITMVVKDPMAMLIIKPAIR